MPDIADRAGRERVAPMLFLATILLGSFLLFLTQPMVARMALPRFGGAPAVWNSAMLVFQALLLAGYAYAHLLGCLAPRRQAALHLLLFVLAALWLPLGIGARLLPPHAEPALWAPWFLVTSVGPLYFMIATQAPLMQRWYALEVARGEPYRLYAASNLGSFAGLISYPLLVEPVLSLHQQSLLWTIGYVLLVLLVAACALTIPAVAVDHVPMRRTGGPSFKKVCSWIVLAAIPSGLMLSTTTHLTTDIVAMPLLWVLPLGLYLLSFVVAFADRQRLVFIFTRIAPLVLLITGGLTFADGSRNPLFSATLGLGLLFVVAVALHGEIYRLRPAADHLTAFYLAMAVGGVLGGLFCAILAPVLFDWTYEHPLLLVAAAFLLPQAPLFPPVSRLWRAYGSWLRFAAPAAALLLSLVVDRPIDLVSGTWAIAAAIIIIVLALVCVGRRLSFALCLSALMLSYGGWWTLYVSVEWDTRVRSYFGVYSITSSPDDSARILTHGTTLHGMQNLDPGHRLEPTTYYAPRSGVGLAMRSAGKLYGPAARIGVVGLGTGTLSCYAQPGQDWRFFEIDPAMVGIARHSGHFTFLSGCAPHAQILLGDARLTLSRAAPGRLDILALDAFSSDTVPMHLLTREAFAVYARALQPKGLLLVHISNRYLDLEPVVAEAAASGGWTGAVAAYYPTDEAAGRHETVSIWIALSRDPAILDGLEAASRSEGRWQALGRRPGFRGWTDDHASILPLLKPMSLEIFNLPQ